jgi:hypothetical protein
MGMYQNYQRIWLAIKHNYMNTHYLKEIIKLAKEGKETLLIRKEIIMDDTTTDEQLGMIIRMMYGKKVAVADETITQTQNIINNAS